MLRAARHRVHAIFASVVDEAIRRAEAIRYCCKGLILI